MSLAPYGEDMITRVRNEIRLGNPELHKYAHMFEMVFENRSVRRYVSDWSNACDNNVSDSRQQLSPERTWSTATPRVRR